MQRKRRGRSTLIPPLPSAARWTATAVVGQRIVCANSLLDVRRASEQGSRGAARPLPPLVCYVWLSMRA